MAYFNAVFVPVMTPILFLMGIAPFARWKEASVAEIVGAVRWAFAAAVLVAIALPVLYGKWSALTALGVFFGLTIFMLMVSFGGSLRTGISKKMSGFATNAVFLWGQRTSEPYAGLPANRPVVYDNDDIEPLPTRPAPLP